MKALIQRVSEALVSVDGRTVGEIDSGLLIFVGIATGDSEQEAETLANKCAELRIFEDGDEKMNLSVMDIGGDLLVISQFTLIANCSKGRRPSFNEAAPPDEASKLYEYFCSYLRSKGIAVEMGKFAAYMDVQLTNDGPVTIMLDTDNL